MLFSSSLAFAEKPKFLCFQFPGAKPQVFEYHSMSCDPSVPESSETLGKKMDYQDAMCAYPANCLPIVDDKDLETFKVPNPADPASQLEINNLMFQKGARQSMVLCKGKAPYIGGFICVDPKANCPPAKCPAIDKCLDQISYNTPGGLVNVVDLETGQPHSPNATKFLVKPKPTRAIK